MTWSLITHTILTGPRVLLVLLRKSQEDPGETVEFYLEDGKYSMEKRWLIRLSRGMKHLLLYLKNTDYPIFYGEQQTVMNIPVILEMK